MKRIVLTGGGTAGHVTPNIALLPRLKELGYEIHYIGSYDGIERKLIEQYHIPYYGIASGKLRRYFDWKNFSDPLKVIKGYSQARSILKKLKPDVLFSKGGFVSVPVVMAAKHRKIPAIIHESDITPGLANKLAIPHAYKVCCNFPETMKYLPAEKAVLTGSPIRKELLSGNRQNGLSFCHFQSGKPVILIMGGSSGSQFINETVRSILPELLKTYQVIHLCGKGNLDASHNNTVGYTQLEYANKELGAWWPNAHCEPLALRKPNILIPLSANASRGDQILNANSFERQGYSMVIEEEALNPTVLLNAVQSLYEKRKQYISSMEKSELLNSVETVVGLIEHAAKTS